MEENRIEIHDTAAEAEEIITQLKKDKNGELELKTNQLRKFLSAINAISNKVDVFQAQHPAEKKLPVELANEIKYLKVKFAYQVGKEKVKMGPIRQFGEVANIKNRIDKIGTNLAKYREFAQFMEALVAYHKFHGGKDK